MWAFMGMTVLMRSGLLVKPTELAIEVHSGLAKVGFCLTLYMLLSLIAEDHDAVGAMLLQEHSALRCKLHR